MIIAITCFTIIIIEEKYVTTLYNQLMSLGDYLFLCHRYFIFGNFNSMNTILLLKLINNVFQTAIRVLQYFIFYFGKCK